MLARAGFEFAADNVADLGWPSLADAAELAQSSLGDPCLNVRKASSIHDESPRRPIGGSVRDAIRSATSTVGCGNSLYHIARSALLLRNL